jgi:hypothetical protein
MTFMSARVRSAAFLAFAAAAATQQGANSIADWVPLAEGTEWQFRTITTAVAGLPPTESRQAVGVLGSYRCDAGVRHVVRTINGGRYGSYEHWQLHRDGLLTLPSCVAHAIADADEGTQPRRLLAGPVGAVSQWTWTEPAEPEKDGTAQEPWTWTARLVAFGETVAVPAGTWPAVHVAAEGRRDEFVRVSHAWYVRGVGLVRDEYRSGDWHSRRELLAFRPGADRTALRAAMLQVQLPSDWLWSPRGPAHLEWLDVGVESLALPGRLALLDLAGTRRCAFVGLERVVPLDAGDAEAWRRLLCSDNNPLDPPSVPTLGRLIARALAHQQGAKVTAVDKEQAGGDAARLGRQAVSVDLSQVNGVAVTVADAQGRGRPAQVEYDAGRDVLQLKAGAR